MARPTDAVTPADVLRHCANAAILPTHAGRIETDEHHPLMNVTPRWLRRLAPLLALAALLLPPAVAETPAIDARAILQRSEGAAKRGILYEVAGSSGTAYLFGTVHLGKAAFYPLGSDVMRAFVAAPCLAVEADVTNAAEVSKLMAELAVYAGDDRLERHLPPALAARAAVLAKRFALPAE